MVFKVPFTFKVYSPTDDSVATHTHIYWESSEDSQYTYGVFFEIVSPLLDLKDREILVQRFWHEFKGKYASGHEFDNSLETAFYRLQEELDNLGLKEGIDANIVVFSAEPSGKQAQSIEDESRILKVAVVGAVDIYLIRGTKYSDLMEYLDVNTDITNIQYNELDIKYGDLLLISNKKILQNLFYGGLLDVNSAETILYSLEQQRENINGGKRVLAILFAELDLASLHSRASVNQLGRSAVIRGLSSLVTKLRYAWYSVLGALNDKLTKVRLRSRYKNINIKGLTQTVPATQLGKPKIGRVGLSTNNVGISTPGIEEEVVVLDDGAAGRISEAKNSADNSLQDGDFCINGSKEAVAVSSGAQQTASMTGMGVLTPNQDPVEYLRNRRNSTYKFKLRFVQLLGRLTNVFPIRQFGLKRGSVGAKQSEWGALTGTKTLGRKNTRFNLYLYTILGSILLILIFVRVRKIRMNKYDTQLIEEFKKEYYAPLRDTYENRVRRLLAGDPQGDITLCLEQYTKLSQAYDSYKVNLKVKTNMPRLEAYLKEAQSIRQKCEDKYYEVYNIQRLATSDLELVKDFKVALGDQSNVVSIDIYQGVIMVLDAGKRAVYKLNQENGSITKVEIDNVADINGELRDIAIGTETFFVCVAQEGVFYYRQASKELRLITGTELSNLGGSCNNIDTYAKNVYIVTELGDGVYRVPGLGGLQYTTPTKYVTYDQGQIIDLSIDGSIFVLVSGQNGGYEIQRYFGGKFDSAFRLEDDLKMRFREPTILYTNPSGYMPLYVYDKGDRLLYIIEKPTRDNHPGVGKLIKTYKLPAEIGEVKDIAVLLSVRDNKEKAIYILTNGNQLYKLLL